jgi:hypothetical protein
LPVKTKKGKGDVQKEPKKGILKSGAFGLERKTVNPHGDDLGEENETSWEGFESEAEDVRKYEEGDLKMNEDGESSLDEEALSHYDALIGGSDDEESFDESKYDLKKTSLQSTRLFLSLSPTPSESPPPLKPSDSESEEALPRPRKTAKVKQPKPPPVKAGTSTFLPTLMGGYWSGSESSASDLESDAAPPVRKNRPGQQARRAIWEKKYGEKANHVKSGQGSFRGKDDGWDARKGARDSTSERGRGRGKGGSGGRDDGRRQRDFRQVTGENAIAVEPRPRAAGKKDDTGVLHPSWQAAKKAKELKNTATFQGKKLTFD